MPDAEEPATNAMLRPYRGLHRLEWSSDQSVNFHLGYGDWIRLLRANGFEIENLIELYPAEGATAMDFPYATNEWARTWPTEEVWLARKMRGARRGTARHRRKPKWSAGFDGDDPNRGVRGSR
jgi:hypothetical protein